MINIGNVVPDNDGWIGQKLRDLERQIAELRSARSLNAAVIQDGAVIVKDAAGHEEARLGKQPDGGYGLSVSDPVTGDTVPLAALAFGMQAESVPDATGWDVPSTQNSGIYWAPAAVTPEVTVSTPNGRVLVIGQANMTATTGGPVWSIEARTTANAVVLARWNGSGSTPHQTANAGQGEGWPMPGMGLVNLPGPGVYKLRMVFGTQAVGVSGQHGSCLNRTLIAFPY